MRIELEFDHPRLFLWPEWIREVRPRMTSRGAEKMITDTIGIDVSKDNLDAHRLVDGQTRCFANTTAGLKALLSWVCHASVDLVAFEPTGPYHRKLEQALAEAGQPYTKINPLRARRFAEGCGLLAKTDRIDAGILARMAALLELEPEPKHHEKMTELRELNAARTALIKDRTAAKNRQKHLVQPLLKRQNRDRIAQIKRQLDAIEKAITALLEADLELNRRLEILTSIPGISSVTAFVMLIEMPELGKLEARQAASLAGLAPVTRQSGRWTGRAHIRGGRSNLRHALYMPAMVAARFNASLKTKYQELIAGGKPGKVAITAIMRKLLITANALLRDNRKWTATAP